MTNEESIQEVQWQFDRDFLQSCCNVLRADKQTRRIMSKMRNDMDLYENWDASVVPHDYVGPYNIEVKELGCWETHSVEEEYFHALDMAGSIYGWDHEWAETKVRIVDNNNKII